MLRGQDSDLLRKLMGLPGKPFPTLPRNVAKYINGDLRFNTAIFYHLKLRIVKVKKWCDDRTIMVLFPFFDQYPNLVVALSEKKDGSCRLPQAGDPETGLLTKENRMRFAKTLGLEEDDIVAANLTHSNNVHLATISDRGTVIPETDAIITNTRGIFLSITVADCLPIFLFDPITNSVGIIHAGWRGLSNEIIHLTIKKMVEELECDKTNIIAGIGPGIGSCHFEIQDDVLAKFKNFTQTALRQENDKKYLDLKAIAGKQLENAGILPSNITIHTACTFDLPEKYFSYRRDKPKTIQAMMAITGIR